MKLNESIIKAIKCCVFNESATDEQLKRAVCKLEPEYSIDELIVNGNHVTDKANIIDYYVFDSYNKAVINDPQFLNKVFQDFTGGASTSEYRYVSNKKLYNLKAEMEHYVGRVCKAAKNGKVDKKLLDAVQNKNLFLPKVVWHLPEDYCNQTDRY